MNDWSENQQKSLLKNKNIEKVTEKHVVFTAAFKMKAIQKFHEGEAPDEIFRKAGVNLKWFKRDYARNCLKRWKKNYEELGEASFKVDHRGKGATGRPRKQNLDELTYEELKTIIEIQKGVIEELKKKKALAKSKR